MASTKTAAKSFSMVPYPVTEIDVSAITAGLEEDYSHGGPSGVVVREIRMEVVTPATSGDPIFIARDTDNDSLTNNTCRLKLYTNVGGDLTDAKVKLYFTFEAMKSGGIS
jgi:hypothetical protein